MQDASLSTAKKKGKKKPYIKFRTLNNLIHIFLVDAIFWKHEQCLQISNIFFWKNRISFEFQTFFKFFEHWKLRTICEILKNCRKSEQIWKMWTKVWNSELFLKFSNNFWNSENFMKILTNVFQKWIFLNSECFINTNKFWKHEKINFETFIGKQTIFWKSDHFLWFWIFIEICELPKKNKKEQKKTKRKKQK